MNLSKDTRNPIDLNFQKTLVHGYTFEFSLIIINQYWECANVPENEVEIPKTNPMVSIIIRGKIRSWPYKYNLGSSYLITSRYSILHKIEMCNWMPTTH